MTTQTVIQREAPDIEALKIGLMEQAKSLTGAEPTGGLPNIQVAEADPLQTAASDWGLSTLPYCWSISFIKWNRRISRRTTISTGIHNRTTNCSWFFCWCI